MENVVKKREKNLKHNSVTQSANKRMNKKNCCKEDEEKEDEKE